MVEIETLDKIKEYADLVSGFGSGASGMDAEKLAWASFSEYGAVIFLFSLMGMGAFLFLLYRGWVGIRDEV